MGWLIGGLFSVLVWLFVLGVCSGCSFGGHFDWIEDGSELTAQYRRNRFSEIRSGVDYGRTTVTEPEPEPVPTIEKEIIASPKNGWQWFK